MGCMATKSDVIRWGIIGCGDVTEVKSGPGFQKASGSALVAVMRRNGALAEDYARRHGVARWYDDADKLISDSDVDAVYIATPPGSHKEYALKVCAAGKPAYIEKPMARSHRECAEMVEGFASARLPLFVAYYRRGLDRFIRAKEIVQAGKLGTVSAVAYRYSSRRHQDGDKAALPWRLNARDAGAGIFLDLASHTLDILDFILGPLNDVSGMAVNIASAFAVEDAVAMQFKTPGGALGVAAWNFASGVSEDLIEITGTDGRLTLSTFGNESIRLISSVGEQKFDLPNPPHIQQPLIQTIVDELLGRGKCSSTGVSGARTSRVMDIALSSYYGGRDDAFWDRENTWPGRR